MKKRSMNRALIIGLAVSGIVLLMIVGLGGLVFLGWGVFTHQAQEAMNRNPVIQEHIGEVESMETDFIATGNEEGEDVFVFRVEGSRGKGVVTAEFVTIDESTEEIRSGTLRDASGNTYSLIPE